MDLSDASKEDSFSSNSNGGNSAEDLVIVPALSKRAQFFASYKGQAGSLPDSLMFYISKNPATPELYQKLIESCKYFFVKNPIIVAFKLCCKKGQWEINRKPYNLDKLLCQFWITDTFTCDVKDSVNQNVVNQNIFTPVLPNLYRCDAKNITLYNHIISYHDLPFFISSAEVIDFRNITVKDENGFNIAVEKIVEVAVKAMRIEIHGANVTSKTMKEFVKIPRFPYLRVLILTDLSDVFDIEAFYAYMKKNERTCFFLSFGNSISNALKNRILEIADEILAKKVLKYKPPFIGFDEMDVEKSKKFFDFFISH